MIRLKEAAPAPGYRFDLVLPDRPAFDFNIAGGIFEKHPRTGIIQYKDPTLRDMERVKLTSANDILKYDRDLDPARLANSIVTDGNLSLPWSDFLIKPSYGLHARMENRALADMLQRIIHSPIRNPAPGPGRMQPRVFPCALEVTAESGFHPHMKNRWYKFKTIPIRDTRMGAYRVVVPKLTIDGDALDADSSSYSDLIPREGTYLLSGRASVMFGMHADQLQISMNFDVKNPLMCGSIGAVTYPRAAAEIHVFPAPAGP